MSSSFLKHSKLDKRQRAPFWQRVFAIATLLIYFAELPLMAAGGIVASPTAPANRPEITGSANGVPVVNIVRPNAKGLSHNKYQEFNVPRQGTILNNSGTDTQTQLGGWVQKNTNFAPADSARLILNEVTGTGISQLAGYLEVAGRPADIIIANPNGIVGTGFGFINTSRVTLATGRPEFDAAGDLRSFAISGGKIIINAPENASQNSALGVNATNLEQFDLLSRAIEINAQIHAAKLNLITGANRVAYADLATEKIAADPAEAAPAVALDVAALGGMYANRIRLVGTEAGLGVNMRGINAAGAGGFTLTSEGKIVHSGRTTSAAALALNARNGIENSGELHSATGTSVETPAAIKNTGLLASAAALNLRAIGAITSTGTLAAGLDAATGNISAPAALTVDSAAAISATGQNLAGGTATFTAASGVSLADSFTRIGGALRLTAGNGTASTRAASLAAASLTVSAPSGIFDNTSGHIEAADISATALSLDNSSGVLVQTGTSALTLRLTAAATNRSGQILSNGPLALTATSLDNSSGLIHAASSATLTLIPSALTEHSGVSVPASLVNTSGQIFSTGPLTLTVGTTATNTSGTIATDSALHLTAASLDNTSGLIHASSSATLTLIPPALTEHSGVTLPASLVNTSGQILSGGALALTVGTAATNTSGTIATDSTLHLTAASLDNTSGLIRAAASATLTLIPPALTERSGVSVPATTFATLTNTTGQILSGGDLLLTVADGTILSSGSTARISADGSLDLRAASLTNEGILSSGTDATLAFTDAATNRSGQILVSGKLTFTAASLDNTSGLVHSASNATLTLNPSALTERSEVSAPATAFASLTNTTGQILSGGDLLLTVAEGTILSSGSTARISADGSLDLRAASLTNEGILSSGTDATLALTGTATNRSGTILATGHLRLTAASFDNAVGLVHSAASATLTLIPSALTERSGVSVPASLVNTSGQILATGPLTLTVGTHAVNVGGTIATDSALRFTASSLDNYAGLLHSAADATLTLLANSTANTLANASGQILATGSLTLNVVGALANTGTGSRIAAGNTFVLSADSFTNTSEVSARNITFTLRTDLANAGEILAADTLAIAFAGNLQNTGTLAAASTLTLRSTTPTPSTPASPATPASSISNLDGSITSGGTLTIAISGAFTNTGPDALLATNAALNLTAASLFNSGEISAARATIALSGAFTSDGGTLYAADALALTSASFDEISTTGAGFFGTGGDLTLASADSFTNAAALYSGGILRITAASIENTGAISAAKSVVLEATTGDLRNTASGTIQSTGTLTLSAAGTLANTGPDALIAAGSALTLTAAALENSAAISATTTADIALTAAFINTGGTLVSGTALHLTAASIANSGTLYGGTTATLTATAGDLRNTALILSKDTLSLTAAAGTVANSGPAAAIISESALALSAASLENSGAISATTSADIALTAAFINTGGTLATNGHLHLTAASFNGTTGAIGAGDISFDISGAFISSTSLVANATSTGSTTSPTSAASHGTLALSAASLENSGSLYSSGTTALTATTGTLRNTSGGSIQSLGTLTLTAATGIFNTGPTARIVTDSSLTLSAASLTNTASISAAANTTLTLTGAFTSTAGSISSGGHLTIKAATANLAATTPLLADASPNLYAASGLTLDISGTFANAATILTLADLHLTAASIENTGSIFARTTATLTARTGDLRNSSGGSIQSLGALSLTAASPSGSISNLGASSTLGTNASLTLTAASFTNSGSVSTTSTANFILSGAFTNSGAVSGIGGLTLSAASATNLSGGSLSAGRAAQGNLPAALAALTITTAATTSTFTNSATISATGDLRISAASGNGDILNTNTTGEIFSTSGNVFLTARKITNTLGAFIGGDAALSLTANTLTNSDSLINFAGNITLDLNGTGSLNNSFNSALNPAAAATTGIRTGGLLKITNAASVSNASGAINAAKGISATLSGAWDNSSGAVVAGTPGFTLTAASLTNTAGSIQSAGTVTLSFLPPPAPAAAEHSAARPPTPNAPAVGVRRAPRDPSPAAAPAPASATLANASGKIAADSALTITFSGSTASALLDNSGGTLSANTTLTLNAAAASALANTGSIQSGGLLTISAAKSAFTNSGVLVGGGVSINTTSFDNALSGTSAGYVGSTAALSFALTSALTNSGALRSTGAITLTAASVTNRSKVSDPNGGISGNAGLTVTTTASGTAFDNSNASIAIFGATNFLLGTGTFNNTNGSVTTAGKITLTATTLTHNAASSFAASLPTNGTAADAALTIALSAPAAFTNSGTLASAGLLSLAANGIKNDGSIKSGAALTLNARSGSFTNTATGTNSGNILAAVGDTTVTATSFTNINATFRVGGSLIYNAPAATLNNTSGTLSAGTGFQITTAGLNNAAGSIIAGNATTASISTGNLTRTNGTIISGGNLTLSFNGDYSRTDTSTDKLSATNNLTIILKNRGSFTNSVTVTDATKDKAFLAGGTFTLTAESITNTAGALLTAGGLNLTSAGSFTNRGRVDADSIAINATRIDNTAVIIGAFVSLDANSISNKGASALIAATEFIGLYTRDFLDNIRDDNISGTGEDVKISGATIFTLGNLVIAGRGGLDENGAPAARAGYILNSSSTIEAAGNATIRASTFDNKKETFTAEEYWVSAVDFGKSHLDTTHKFTVIKPGSNHTIFSGLSYYEDGDKRSTWLAYTVNTYATRITEDSPGARLLIGGNLNVSGGDVVNYLSTIAVGETLNFDSAGNLENLSVVNAVTAKYSGKGKQGASVLTPGVVAIYELDPKPQTFGPDEYETSHIGLLDMPDEITNVADPRFSARIYAKTITGTLSELYNGTVGNDGYNLGSASAAYNAAKDARKNIQNNSTSNTTVTAPTIAGIDQTSVTGHDPTSAGSTGDTGVGGKTVTNSGPVSDKSAATVGSVDTSAADSAPNPADVGNETDVGPNTVVVNNENGNNNGNNGNNNNTDVPDVGKPAIADIPSVPPPGDGSGSASVAGNTKITSPLALFRPENVTFSAPQNPLYTTSTDPAHPYLVETDPRFADRETYVSSDYYFSQLAFDPQATHKRLGDAAYENQLVRDQITSLTGKYFLGDYTSNDAQYKALMDNALVAAEAFHLRPGIALSALQIAALTSDIVWLVEVSVNGQNVLAPVVYLGSATRAQIENGAVIGARDIDLEVLGGLTNNGTIRADNDMRLQAANLINNDGSLKAGGDMTLISSTDITSQAGKIFAGGNASLIADRDILLETVASSTDYGLSTRTTVNTQTVDVQGDLTVNAGNNLTASGVNLNVGGAALLKADGTLTIQAVQTVETLNIGTDKNYIHTETIANILGGVNAGNGLTLISGADMLLQAAQLNAGTGNLTAIAAGNIIASAAVNRDFSDIKTTASKSMTRVMTDDETVLGTTFAATGSIGLFAGYTVGADGSLVASASSRLDSTSASAPVLPSLTLTSATLQSGGATTLAAVGDINLGALGEHHELLAESYTKKSGLLSSKTTTTSDHIDANLAVVTTIKADSLAISTGRDLNAVGTIVTTTGDLSINAARDINITAAESTLSAEHSTTTKKSGLTGSLNLSLDFNDLQAGAGLSAGTQKASSTQSILQITQSQAQILAGGDLQIVAGGNIEGAAAILSGAKRVVISGENVNLGEATETSTSTLTQKTSFSGVTVGASVAAVDFVNAAIAATKKGGLTDDNIRILINKNPGAVGTSSIGTDANGNAAVQTNLGLVNVSLSAGSIKKSSTSTQNDTIKIGSQVLSSEGTISIEARGNGTAGTGNLTLSGTYVSAAGAVNFQAANDIIIKTSLDTSTQSDKQNTSAANQFGTNKTNAKGDSTLSTINQSTISGSEINMQAGNNINISGANLIADTGIHLQAVTGDVTIDVARASQTATSSSRNKLIGLANKSIVGVSLGLQSQSNSQGESGDALQGSFVSTGSGSLIIQAGNNINIIGSDLYTPDDLYLGAKNIKIIAAETTQSGSTKQKVSSAGLTLELRGTVVSAAMALKDTLQKATGADDERLQGALVARAGRHANELYTEIGKLTGDLEDPNKGAGPMGIEAALSIGASGSKSSEKWANTSSLGSTISGGNVYIIAPKDGGEGEGFIQITGSDINGTNIKIVGKTLLLDSAKNTQMQTGKNSNYAGAIGVAIGITQTKTGISIFAEGSGGVGSTKGNGSEDTNTHINASENLHIDTSGDVTLAGAVLSGKQITGNIGGDLLIASGQDFNKYDAQQIQAGASGSYAFVGQSSASVNGSYSKTKNDYLSVTEQSGIKAGEGGFNIYVEGGTTLAGGVISSTADPSKNHFSTNTLTFSDIKNHADFYAIDISVGVSSSGIGSEQGAKTGGGASMAVPQFSNEDSITRSAISAGTLIVRSDFDANGNRIADSAAGLLRDATSTSGVLENKFDLEKIQLNQELGKIVGEESFRLVGAASKEVHDRQYASLQADLKSGRITQEEYNYQSAALDATWGEGGAAKIILHATAGALTAAAGGGDALGGLLGAAASEAVKGTDAFKSIGRGAIGDLTKNLLSTGIGLAAGGGSGAATALSGDRFNRQLHQSEKDKLAALAKELANDPNNKWGIKGTEAEILARLTNVASTMVLSGAEDGASVDNIKRQAFNVQANNPNEWNLLHSEQLSAYKAWLPQSDVLNRAGSPALDGSPHYFLEYGPGWAFEDQMSTVRAYIGVALGGVAEGTVTGSKAVVNGGANTLYGLVTLGTGGRLEPWAVTEQDRRNNYEMSEILARGSWEVATAAAGGALLEGGKVLNWIGKGYTAIDTAGNVVTAGSGAYDMSQNGVTFENSVQVIGGGLGAGGNTVVIFGKTSKATDAVTDTIKAETKAADAATTNAGKQITNLENLSATKVNAGFTAAGKMPPFPEGTIIRQFEAANNLDFVRVHNAGNPQGVWLVRAEEIKGMTAEQVQKYLALPTTPTHIQAVTVPKGTTLQMGRVGPQADWGVQTNGGVQYRSLDRLPDASFGKSFPLK